MTYQQKMDAVDKALMRFCYKRGLRYPAGIIAGVIIADKSEGFGG